MTWNHGYNTDLGYTYGYYREQSPVWIDLCAAFHGSRPRGTAGEARRYLELGCGQGGKPLPHRRTAPGGGIRRHRLQPHPHRPRPAARTRG